MSHSEFAVFLTLKRLTPHKPHFLAFDWFMPGQEASSGEVSLDAADCRKYFEALENVPYYKEHGLHKNLAHLHSHGNMGVFWSGTDDKQQFTPEELGFQDDFRFFTVVDSRCAMKCSLTLYRPMLYRVDAACALVFSSPAYTGVLDNARKKEIDDIVAGHVKNRRHVASYTVTGGRYGYHPSYGSYHGPGWLSTPPALARAAATPAPEPEPQWKTAQLLPLAQLRTVLEALINVLPADKPCCSVYTETRLEECLPALDPQCHNLMRRVLGALGVTERGVARACRYLLRLTLCVTNWSLYSYLIDWMETTDVLENLPDMPPVAEWDAVYTLWKYLRGGGSGVDLRQAVEARFEDFPLEDEMESDDEVMSDSLMQEYGAVVKPETAEKEEEVEDEQFI
jgi:hypothetical protein